MNDKVPTTSSAELDRYRKVFYNSATRDSVDDGEV